MLPGSKGGVYTRSCGAVLISKATSNASGCYLSVSDALTGWIHCLWAYNAPSYDSATVDSQSLLTCLLLVTFRHFNKHSTSKNLIFIKINVRSFYVVTFPLHVSILLEVYCYSVSKFWSYVSYRDEKVVSQAVELNEQLERVLRRHDALVDGRAMSTSNHIDHVQEEEEEEAEQLFRRYA